MNLEEVYKFIDNYRTFCACGKTEIYAWSFEYASDLMSWLNGEPIYHLGLTGCCEEEE